MRKELCHRTEENENTSMRKETHTCSASHHRENAAEQVRFHQTAAAQCPPDGGLMAMSARQRRHEEGRTCGAWQAITNPSGAHWAAAV